VFRHRGGAKQWFDRSRWKALAGVRVVAFQLTACKGRDTKVVQVFSSTQLDRMSVAGALAGAAVLRGPAVRLTQRPSWRSF
jgi:hypothetical protein